MTRDLAWRVEDACFNAWPALRSVFHGDWLLRFGEGVSRRSNSVNPMRADVSSIAPHLAPFAELYRAQDLPLIVRVPSLISSSIDRELEQHGLGFEGESCVLHGDLSGRAPTSDPATEVLSQATEHWLAAMSALQRHSPAQAATYRRVIAMIALPAAFALLRRDGEIVATAYGAIHDGLLCCESVVVSDRYRGHGHARRMMTALFAWAASNGAEAACLQVAADNVAGLALYRSIGLTELHRYHYRRAPSD
jgi:ribosomal protein S18 acetylase RimI-like enzyme